MDQYVVLCDCSPDGPHDVGYIDDDRARSGRFGFDPWPPQDEGLGRPRKRGDRLPARQIRCRRCDLAVALSHTTAAEVVDLIVAPSPENGTSLRDAWGKTAVPFEGYADEHAERQGIAEFEAMLAGQRDQNQPSEAAMVTRIAHLYVIPLRDLRRIVSRLDKRR